jgi:hypothetical protein
MDPRRPICRETEGVGLGRREGPTGWNPLPPAGAIGRKEGRARPGHIYFPSLQFPILTPFHSGLVLANLAYSSSLVFLPPVLLSLVPPLKPPLVCLKFKVSDIPA